MQSVDEKMLSKIIQESKKIPPGVVYTCSEPEFIGKMPIRECIDVIKKKRTYHISG